MKINEVLRHGDAGFALSAASRFKAGYGWTVHIGFVVSYRIKPGQSVNQALSSIVC
jgi:hypothetical protein